MNTFLYISFLLLLSYFISINFIYFFLALLSQRRNILRIKQSKYTDFNNIMHSFLTIPVSIIIAAFDEEKVIINSVYSCLKLNYPELEVIVVSDGSTDRTLEILIEEFDLYIVDFYYRVTVKSAPVKSIYRSRIYENLLVVNKVHGGKADSLNAGINTAKYRYICSTDADSIFNKDGMVRLMRLVILNPANVVAIGGHIRISNGLKVTEGEIKQTTTPKKLLPAIQAIEYMRTFIANRLGWSSINAQLVISGAFGLWRKDAVIERGGFSTTTTHEDIEMTFNLHCHFRKIKKDYAIISMSDPVTWTEVPETFTELFKQRERWQRVVIEVFVRYKRMLFNYKYGTVGMFGMPYYFIYEIMGPYIEVFSYFVIIIAFILNGINYSAFALFFVVSIGISALISLVGLLIEQYDYDTYNLSSLPKLIFVALIEPIWYRQFLDLARMLSIVNFLRGKKGWQRAERIGT